MYSLIIQALCVITMIFLLNQGAFAATVYHYADATSNANFLNANSGNVVRVHLDDYKETDNDDMNDDRNGKYMRVSVLLPLTGKYGEIAQSILDGIIVRLNSDKNNKVKLYIYDTAFNNDTLLMDVQRLNLKGTDMIIGPLFEPSLDIVRNNLKDQNIPIFYLGENLAKPSPNVYKFTFSSRQEISSMLQYIANKQEAFRQETNLDGKTIIGALVPNTAYGDTVAKSLKEQADAMNLKIETIARYGEGKSEMSQAINEIRKVKDRISTLFISGEGDALRSLIATIPFFGIDQEHIRFIATSALYQKWLPFEPVMLGSYTATPMGQDYRAASYHYNKMLHKEIDPYAYIGYSLWKYVGHISKDYYYMKRKMQQAVQSDNGANNTATAATANAINGQSINAKAINVTDQVAMEQRLLDADNPDHLQFDIVDNTFANITASQSMDLITFIRTNYFGKSVDNITLNYDGNIYRKMYIYETVHKKMVPVQD